MPAAQNESTGFVESLRAVERDAGDLETGSGAYGGGAAIEIGVPKSFFFPSPSFHNQKSKPLTKKFSNNPRTNVYSQIVLADCGVKESMERNAI